MDWTPTSENNMDGHLEIRVIKNLVSEPIDESLSIHINGDPEGLTSLAEYLLHFAQINQEAIDDKILPQGAREHRSLIPNVELSRTSNETVIGRLDMKGGSELPHWYVPKNRKP